MLKRFEITNFEMLFYVKPFTEFPWGFEQESNYYISQAGKCVFELDFLVTKNCLDVPVADKQKTVYSQAIFPVPSQNEIPAFSSTDWFKNKVWIRFSYWLVKKAIEAKQQHKT